MTKLRLRYTKVALRDMYAKADTAKSFSISAKHKYKLAIQKQIIHAYLEVYKYD